VRWSDSPNITADPVNGTYYAVWTQYRTASTPGSAAIYLSRSTDGGNTWSAPVIPYNNPNANIFQGFGWVSVSKDQTVHVTYLGGTSSNSVVAQYYVQSTNGGSTWSAPFQLSNTTFGPFGTTTDYEANDVGGYSGGNATILAAWAENSHFAKLGTFLIATPTPTATPCSPVPCTFTPTATATRTATPTATPCGASGNYIFTTSTGASIVAGTIDIGNHADDVVTNIALPFSFTFYGTAFASVNASSNGNLQFTSSAIDYSNICLPFTTFNNAILAHWDDLNTANNAACPGGICGIFTSVSGASPNRIFNVEWRAVYLGTSTYVNFEIRLYETSGRIDFVYGTIPNTGISATSGVQRDTGSLFTQFSCNSATLTNSLLVTFTQPACATPTFTFTPTRTATVTFTRTATSTLTRTPTVTLTSTNTPTSVATFTPTRTRTVTNTPSPTPRRIVGHVTWQGRPAQPNALQALPITLTLKLGTTEVNFPAQNTDASGFFTVSTSLPNGTYNWRVKGPDGVVKALATDQPGFLANAGSVTLTGVPQTNVEMGLMLAGDANNDNSISITDFNILKNTFGKSPPDPLYDNRADFNGDVTISIADFNLLKNTFGTAGAPPN